MRSKYLWGDKFTTRMISAILALCMLIGFAPVPSYASASGDSIPTAIQAELKKGFVEIGTPVALQVSDDQGNPIEGATLSFESKNQSIAEVNAAGKVTGVTIGRTEITVNADYNGNILSTTVPVTVVGENLLIRSGVNHGEFEADGYVPLVTPSSEAVQKFLWRVNNGATGNYKNAIISFEDMKTPLSGDGTARVLKHRFEEISSKNGSGAWIRESDMKLEAQAGYPSDAGTGIGLVKVDNSKLYELTAWVMADEVTTLGTDTALQVMGYDDNGSAGKFVTNSHLNTIVKPWEGKSGDQDWELVRSPATLLADTVQYVSPTFTGVKQDKLGNFYIAHLSYHEVIYDELRFTAQSDVDALAKGATVATTVSHYTNTGTEIKAAKDGSGAPITVAVQYASDAPEVATVDESTGEITAVGGGNAKITATATIGDVKKSASVNVTVQDSSSGEATGPDTFVFNFMAYTTDNGDVRPLGFAQTDNTWAFEKESGFVAETNSHVYIRNNQGYGVQVQTTAAGQWLAFQINVPSTGDFKLQFAHGSGANGGIGNIYIAPVNTAEEQWRATEHLIGEANYSETTAGKYVTVTTDISKTVHFDTAGKYIVCFEVKDKGDGGKCQMYPNKLTFTRMGQEPEVAPASRIYNYFKLGYRYSPSEVAKAQELDKNLPEGEKPHYYNDIYNKGVPLDTVTFAGTTQGDPAEIFPDSTAKTDPYEFAGKGGSSLAAFFYAAQAYGLMLDKVNNDSPESVWGAFKLQVKESGYYSPASVNGHWASGSIVRIYLAPEDAENPRAAEYSIGVIDTYLSTPNWKKNNKLRAVYLEEGNYILSYESFARNSSNTADGRFTVQAFHLNGITSAELPTMTISGAEIPEIKVGQSALSPLTAVMSDSSIEDLWSASITAVPEDSSVATVAVVPNSNKMGRSIQVTGEKVGATTIHVEATLANGVKSAVQIPVTVVGGSSGILDSAKLSLTAYPSGRVAVKTKLDTALSLKDTDGNTIDTNKATVTYSVEPADAAEVDQTTGVITTKEKKAAVVTAAVTVGDVTKEAKLNLDIQESSENLFTINPNFEQDASIAANWPWEEAIRENQPNTPVWRRIMTGVTPKDGNDNNKAMKVVMDPSVEVAASGAMVYGGNKRVPIEFGKLYEMSVWVKLSDMQQADKITIALDAYAFDSPSGGSLTGLQYRGFDVHNEVGYPDSYSEWQKVTLWVAAPFENTSTKVTDKAYITPRFSITKRSSSFTGTGIGGTVWFDDFELREVGFDTLLLNADTISSEIGGTAQLTITPVTTTGAKIGVLNTKVPELYEVNSTNPEVATISQPAPQIKGSNVCPAVSTITTMGKGDTTLSVSLNLNGEVRTATLPLTITNAEHALQLNYGKTDFLVGESATAKLSGSMIDGQDLSKATIVYSSSKPTVAAVNTSTGAMATLSEGKTDITVSVTLNGVTKTHTVTIVVTDNTPLASVKVTAPSKDISIRSKTQLTVSGTMESGKPACIDNAEVAYKVTSGDAVTVSETGEVSAVKVGTATVMVTVTLRGVEKTATIDFNVADSVEFHQEYNFAEGTSGQDRRVYKASNWSTNNEHDPTIVDPNDETKVTYIRSQPYGIQVQSGGVGQWLAVRIKVEEPGYYTPSMTVAGASSGCVFRTFIAPSSADAASWRDAQYSIGTINCYSQEYVQEFNTVKMRSILFPTAGEYVVNFQVAGTRGGCMYLGKLVLDRIGFAEDDPQEVLPDFKLDGLKPERNNMYEDEVISIPLTAEMSDGAFEDLFSAEIFAESADDTKITATVISDSKTNAKSIQLKALELGDNIDITISVILSGKTNSITFPLSVVPIGTGAPPTKEFNFKEYVNKGKPIDATLEKDGFRIIPELTSAYVQSFETGLRYQVYGIGSQIRPANVPIDSDTALEVKLQYGGNYQIQFSGGQYGSGGIVALYVDGVYVGEYDCYGNAVVEGPTASMRSLYLEAGNHTVTFRTVGTSSYGCNQYIGMLRFKGIEELPTLNSITAASTRSELAAGESARFDSLRNYLRRS